MSAPTAKFGLGVRYHRAGRLAEAETLYREVLGLTPKASEPLHMLGLLALQSGRFEDAADWLARAVAENDGHPDIHNRLGIAHAALGRRDRALAHYRRALALDADHAEAHTNLGNFLAKQGDVDGAIAHYRQAVASDAGLAQAHNNLGVALARAGRGDEAEAAYKAALARDPGYAEAHNNLGALRLAEGAVSAAEAAFRAALQTNPDYVDARINLASLLRKDNRYSESVVCYRKALDLRPGSADLHNDLGVALELGGDRGAARESFERALALSPDFSEAHRNLGVALANAGEIDAAVQHLALDVCASPNDADRCVMAGRVLDSAPEAALRFFRQALKRDPDHVPALNGVGRALRALRDRDGSMAHFKRALAHDGDDLETLVNMANLLAECERLDEAEDVARHALAVEPDSLQAMMTLGGILKVLGRHREAIALLERACVLAPNDAEAHNNLGNALAADGMVDAAVAIYERAIDLAPELPGPRQNLGMALLLDGIFDRGFDSYDWRWRDETVWQRVFPQAPWQGDDLAGRTILVWGEQGVGDQIMLASVLPEVVAAAGGCVIECERRLAPLFARSFPDAEVVALAKPADPRTLAPTIDVQSSVGSLCRWVRRDAESFAGRRAYLRADPEKVSRLRARYRDLGPGLKVGLAWHSRAPQWGLIKSAPVALWGPILRQPDVTFVNLQYGDCAEDVEEIGARFGVSLVTDPEIDQMESLDDFAAQIAALDLVISISNTTVHIAGGLGQRVWTLLPHVPDWRWGLSGEETLWYPRMRLFRQPRHGDWSAPIAAAAEALGTLVADQ